MPGSAFVEVLGDAPWLGAVEYSPPRPGLTGNGSRRSTVKRMIAYLVAATFVLGVPVIALADAPPPKKGKKGAKGGKAPKKVKKVKPAPKD
jgi:hypothetical protein